MKSFLWDQKGTGPAIQEVLFYKVNDGREKRRRRKKRRGRKRKRKRRRG